MARQFVGVGGDGLTAAMVWRDGGVGFSGSFFMDGELYIHTSFSSMLGLGGCTIVLLSPPGFYTSFRGVTGVWHDGLLALVVVVLTAATVWHNGLLALGSLTCFFM